MNDHYLQASALAATSYANMEFSLPFSTVSAVDFLPFLLFLCGLFFLLISRIYSNKKRLPPLASGSWPIIGHLHLFKPQPPPHITLAELADKYGPIFTIHLGRSRAVIVSNWELAKECLSTKDKIFANRPKSVAFELVGLNYAMFGFTSYGPYWRHARKLATVELLSDQRLATFQDVRESEVKALMKEIHQRCVSNEVVLEMKSLFGDLTLNLITLIVIGERYVEYKTSGENEKSHLFKKTMEEFDKYSGGFLISDIFPFLKWLDVGGQKREMKKTSEALNHEAEKWLNEHKRKRECGEGNGEKDFMEIMLSILQEQKLPGFDADTANKALSMNLILAGYETTKVGLIWILALLLNNPDKLKKAQHELDMKIGRERQVTEADMKNLVYLKAVIKESMRLYPVVPLLIPHESMEDCVVDDYHIPKGTKLIVNAYKIHRNPQIWSNPDEFIPERFLTTHKDLDLRGRSFEFIPFGSGRRMCPGISFSLQVLELTIAALLHGFGMSTPSGEPIDMTESAGLTNQKATKLQLLLSPRLPLYA